MLEQLSNEHLSQDTSKAEVQLRLLLLFLINFINTKYNLLQIFVAIII